MEPVEGRPPTEHWSTPVPEAWLWLEETGNPSSRRVGIVTHGYVPATDYRK